MLTMTFLKVGLAFEIHAPLKKLIFSNILQIVNKRDKLYKYLCIGFF